MTSSARRPSLSSAASRPLPRLVALTAILLALVLGAAPHALAHSALVGSSPKDGATLERAPRTVTLTFNEEIGAQGSAVVVTAPSGEEVSDADSLAVDGAEVAVDLTPLREAGQYRTAYRVVSADGHVIQGTLDFRYAPPAEPTDDAAPSTEPSDATEIGPAVEPLEDASVTAAQGEDDERGNVWLALFFGFVAMLIGVAAYLTATSRGRRA